MNPDLIRLISPQHKIWKQGQIAGRYAEGALTRIGDLFVTQINRTTQAFAFDHGVVILQWLTGGCFMHELYMIRLNEVFHQQLPVGTNLTQFYSRNRTIFGYIGIAQYLFEWIQILVD